MDQKNMILAIVLSIAIILGFYYFFELPRIKAQQEALEVARARQTEQQQQQKAAGPAESPAAGATAPAGASRPEALAATPRLRIDSARLTGSIALTGARIDDLVLDDYKVTTTPGSPKIELLNPVGGANPYFAEFGWVAQGGSVPVPQRDSVWQASGQTLTPDQPVTLSWDNGAGLRFERIIALDRDYMFTVTQRVVNQGSEPVTLYPYGRVVRVGTPVTAGFYILHEGLIGVLNGTLREVDYEDAPRESDGRVREETTGGWLGITDKYWLVALAPDQQQTVTGEFSVKEAAGTPNYQADYLGGSVTVAPGAAAESTSRLFAGAKEVKLLERYRDQLGLPLFERAVDFGLLWFLTQPIFWVLDKIYRVAGNFGVAILLLTVMVKLLFLPLANKSYRAMSQMKKLAPQMQELKERHGEDRQKLNQEMMALYKREKVNPVSGCLPVVIQIPVFFALYKVLFVTIEMRHAPFYGWIQDLSAPDPTSIFNLFGLIPWDPPSLLAIGAWPLIMGVTMFLQQKLNPAPPDPIQAKMFMALPVVFTFMLAQFPAGLVIYWAWNNVLSIAQQRFIMWRMGVKP